MRRLVRVALIACLVLASSALRAQSGEPYEFVRIEGLSEQVVGEQLLTEIYKRAGIAMSIEAMTGSRALEEATSGRKDGETLRIFAVGERFPSLKRVPTAISDLTTIGFGIRSRPLLLSNEDQLANYSLVRVRGVQHTKNISEGLPNVYVLPRAELLIEFLSRGRADVGLEGRLNGLSLIKKSGIDTVGIVGRPLKVLKLYHYIHEDHEELVPRIDAVIKDMVDSGDMSTLRAKYEQEYLDAIPTVTR